MRNLSILSSLFILLFSLALFADTEINGTNKSSLELILNYKERSFRILGVTEKPLSAADGSIFTINARPGVTVRFKIEKINIQRYEVKLAGAVQEPTKFEWPSVFSEAFKNLLQPIKDKMPSEKKSALRNLSTGDNMELFVKYLNKLDVLTDMLSHSEKISKIAEDWESLKKQIQEYGKDKLGQYFGDGSVPENWTDKASVDDIFKQAIECLQKLIETRIKYEGELGQDPTTSALFILSAMRGAEKKALDFEKQCTTIKEKFQAYFDPEMGEKQFIYTAPKAFTASGAKLSLKLEIGNKSEKSPEQPIYCLDFEFSCPQKAFFDVSTGVFFTSVHNASYSLEATATGENGAPEKHIVRKGAEDCLPFSFGAMVHRGYALGHEWAVALSLGLVSGDKSYQVFLGPSIAHGLDQKIYLSFGLSAGWVKRLKGYKENDAFSGSAADIPTENVSRIGCFFGISYKL